MPRTRQAVHHAVLTQLAALCPSRQRAADSLGGASPTGLGTRPICHIQARQLLPAHCKAQKAVALSECSLANLPASQPCRACEGHAQCATSRSGCCSLTHEVVKPAHPCSLTERGNSYAQRAEHCLAVGAAAHLSQPREPHRQPCQRGWRAGGAEEAVATGQGAAGQPFEAATGRTAATDARHVQDAALAAGGRRPAKQGAADCARAAHQVRASGLAGAKMVLPEPVRVACMAAGAGKGDQHCMLSDQPNLAEAPALGGEQ